jgi:hypothetical protein
MWYVRTTICCSDCLQIYYVEHWSIARSVAVNGVAERVVAREHACNAPHVVLACLQRLLTPRNCNRVLTACAIYMLCYTYNNRMH